MGSTTRKLRKRMPPAVTTIAPVRGHVYPGTIESISFGEQALSVLPEGQIVLVHDEPAQRPRHLCKVGPLRVTGSVPIDWSDVNFVSSLEKAMDGLTRSLPIRELDEAESVKVRAAIADAEVATGQPVDERDIERIFGFRLSARRA